VSTNTPAWTTARLVACRDLSPTVREFDLLPDDGVRPWTVGAHLRLQVQLAGQGVAERRYSLVGLPVAGLPVVGLPQGTPGASAQPASEVYRINVKRVAPSRGGSAYLWGLAPGDRVALQHPQNHFELPLSAPQTLLIAGGIGITPLLGMALTLAGRGADVHLAYAVRHAVDLVHADALQSALGPRLRCYAGDRHERLDLTAEISQLHPKAQALVCGPITLLHAVQAAWAAAGRPPQRLRFETFGSSGTAPAQAFTVRVPRHGVEAVVPADRTLLQVLQEQGVQVLAECQRGECGLCAVDVLAAEGTTLDHRDVFLSPREKAQGQRLCACVSRACGGTLVIDSAWRPDDLDRPLLRSTTHPHPETRP
jgi:ferredoxin-NADP reductase